MFRNLVLSGGAFKSAAFIGCIEYLEQEAMCADIINVVGSSAGAVVALMFVAGFTSAEMKDYVLKESKRFLEAEIDFENVLDIFYTLGMDDGQKHVEAFGRILEAKGMDPASATFLSLAKQSGRNLVVCGSNLTAARVEYFSVDTHPDMQVVDAVRISIAIPFLLTPVEYKGAIYVDASLFDNFATEYFCDPGRPLTDTLALCITGGEDTALSSSGLADMNLLTYMHLLTVSMFYRLNKKNPSVETSPTNKTVCIDIQASNFDTESFRLRAEKEEIEGFIEKGYETICAALKGRGPLNARGKTARAVEGI
jgi:predicted acylesterase/phospholipase RssA